MTTKNQKVNVSIIIPVYNEEKILAKQIDDIRNGLSKMLKKNYEIIIVANGCLDETEKIAESLLYRYNEIRLLVCNKADYGFALRLGMLASTGKVIVNFDLDFYDLNFLYQALVLEPFGYDIIVASKNIRLSKDKRKIIRRFISGFYKYLLYYGFGLQVSDTHGIKAWRNDNKLKMLIDKTVNNKEIFDTELIIRSQYNGRKLLELPTEVVEMRKSVTSILKRATRGFFQITKLWIRLKILEAK